MKTKSIFLASILALSIFFIFNCGEDDSSASKYTNLGKKWTLATDEPGWSEREYHKSIVYDNKIWIFAGYDKDWHYGDVWSSKDGINWEDEENNIGSILAGDEVCICEFKDKFWVISEDGIAYSKDLKDWNSVEIDDGNVWNNKLLTDRNRPKCVVNDDKIWIIGGTRYPNDDVWSSSDGIKWKEISEDIGEVSRTSAAVVSFDNKIWIIGGHTTYVGDDSEVKISDEVWSSSDGEKWKLESNLPRSRKGHTSLVFDNKIWVISGNCWNEEGYVFYSSDGKEWIEASDDAPSRCGHSSVAFDNKLWIFGGDSTGEGGSDGFVNEVWYSD